MSPIYECIVQNSCCFTPFKLEACQHFYNFPLHAFSIVEKRKRITRLWCDASGCFSLIKSVNTSSHSICLCLWSWISGFFWAPGGLKLCSLWLSDGAVSSHHLSAGFAFMPAPPFDLRRFQEPQLQLHFPQEFFKPLYKLKDNLEIWMWWHRIPILFVLPGRIFTLSNHPTWNSIDIWLST